MIMIIVTLVPASQILLTSPPLAAGQGATYIDGGISVYGDSSSIHDSPIVIGHFTPIANVLLDGTFAARNVTAFLSRSVASDL
jgi:hypothetical protein